MNHKAVEYICKYILIYISICGVICVSEKQRKVLISVPEGLLNEIDGFLENERDNCLTGSRSAFIRAAMETYVKNCKNQLIYEQLRRGYESMGAVNLNLAEDAAYADDEDFGRYEKYLHGA